MVDALALLQSLSLGPYATIALFGIIGLETLVGIGLGVIVVKQRTTQTAIHNTESAAQAANIELQVLRERDDRITEENRELIKRIERLSTLTSLEPLSKELHDWIAEGRFRFDAAMKRLNEIHDQQSIALASVLEELRAQRISSEESYRATTEALKEQATLIATHTLEDRQYQLRTLGMIDTIERRLSMVAVQIGMSEWSVKIESDKSM